MLEILVEALKQLNNREMAIGIWLVVALTAALLAKSVRTGLADVLKCLLMPKLLLLFGSLAAYVALLAWLLSQVQLWTFDQLTATILWYFLSGVGLLNGVFSIKEGDRHFAKLARSAFTLTVVVEFVAVAYTFGLLAELVLVPVLVFLGLLSGVAGTKPKYGPTKRLLEWVLAAFGILLTWVSIRQIVVDPTAFFTTATGRSFVLPIALTLGSFPLLYLWYAVTKLESAFISIGLKNYPPDPLKKFARRKFTRAFIIRPWLIERAVRQFHSLPIKDKADVDQIVAAIREHERLSKNPPAVPTELGWSPFLARDFLVDQGLRTGDYHSAWDQEEYFASSPYVDLDDGILPNHVAFYVEGSKAIATTLKLKGDFRAKSETEAALSQFQVITIELVKQGLGLTEAEAHALVPGNGDFSTSHGPTKIDWQREPYPSGQGFDVRFTLTRNAEQ